MQHHISAPVFAARSVSTHYVRFAFRQCDVFSSTFASRSVNAMFFFNVRFTFRQVKL